jgi:hypothetical protein
VIDATAGTNAGPIATTSPAIGRDTGSAEAQRPTHAEAITRSSNVVARRASVAIAYLVLGAILVVSRFVGLGRSFWLDEEVFVEDYVRKGPREILTGSGLSHELYGLIAWAISATVGESEIALRLCSAVPFVLGVGLVTVWLHRRVHPVAGLLYLLLATASPLLLDITRSARGYGLAFCAMSALVIAALEADRTARTFFIAVACLAGVIGTWTLPQFGLAFAGVGISLVANDRIRSATLAGLAASFAAILVWYAPHIGQVEQSSQIPQGIRISPQWLLAAPFDHVLFPALIWIDGVVVVPGLVWLPLIAALAIILGSSPLLRRRGSALVLCAPVVATIGVLFLARAYVLPRYVSFLLVPLFILLSSGASSLLAERTSRLALIRGAACLAVFALLIGGFAATSPAIMELPREANRDVAAIVESRTPAATPIYASVRDPIRLDFYLDRPFRVVRPSEVVARVCGSNRLLAYVAEPWTMPRVRLPCLRRSGVEHHGFEQYTRGGEVNVWFIPPRDH